jgi:hypothetical protein
MYTFGLTENIFSHVIFFYLPTVKILQHLHSQKPAPLTNEPQKVLVVTMFTTAGGHAKVNAEAEVSAIMERDSASSKITRLKRPSKENVKNELAICTIVYFGYDSVEKLTINEVIDVAMQGQSRQRSLIS